MELSPPAAATVLDALLQTSHLISPLSAPKGKLNCLRSRDVVGVMEGHHWPVFFKVKRPERELKRAFESFCT